MGKVSTAAVSNSDVFLKLAATVGQSVPAKRLVEFKLKFKPDGNPRYWAIADFNQHSAKKRFYVFDTKAEKIVQYLVAHGVGSEGAKDDGMAEVFSNVPNSLCSSLGIYLCLDEYVGKHGKSLRLEGLEATNSNALARDIVLHSAEYVSESTIKKSGRIGRSHGCFVVEDKLVGTVVGELKKGSFIIAWKKTDEKKLDEKKADEKKADAKSPAPKVEKPPAPKIETGTMRLGNKKPLIERIINVFETGTTTGDYSKITIFHDGPGKIRQITYGRSQTTEYGNLKRLVKDYATAGGTLSHELGHFAERVGTTPLTDDAEFKNLLKRAGREDPIMKKTQDAFFDAVYFKPAMKWADEHKFTKPLSALVIYDSFIHSGSIRKDIRSRFPESPPSSGGNEKAWITAYVNARHDWLANHSNPVVHPTIYRTECFKREIQRGNWDLSKLPIDANGTDVL